MKPHSIALLALTAVLAVPVPAFAQTVQGSPLPSAEPSSGPGMTMPAPAASADPSAAPAAEPSAEPSASPSHGTSLGKRALRGVLKSLKGTKAVLKLADGTMQTFNVTSQTASLLKSHLGKNGVFRVVDGVLTLVPSGVPGY
jgi:Spy/CpxP family protein refolding chaperone